MQHIAVLEQCRSTQSPRADIVHVPGKIFDPEIRVGQNLGHESAKRRLPAAFPRQWPRLIGRRRKRGTVSVNVPARLRRIGPGKLGRSRRAENTRLRDSPLGIPPGGLRIPRRPVGNSPGRTQQRATSRRRPREQTMRIGRSCLGSWSSSGPMVELLESLDVRLHHALSQPNEIRPKAICRSRTADQGARRSVVTEISVRPERGLGGKPRAKP